jgi:hypothetical protein
LECCAAPTRSSRASTSSTRRISTISGSASAAVVMRREGDVELPRQLLRGDRGRPLMLRGPGGG